MKIKSLTIYCSSSQKLDKKFYKMAKDIAKIISNHQIKVIYGTQDSLLDVVPVDVVTGSVFWILGQNDFFAYTKN